MIKKIIDYNIYESNCIGIVCSPSKQYNDFQKLKSMISENELFQLTKHDAPVIRAYASTELIKLNKSIIEMFAFEINKNEKVETQDGCLGGMETVSSIIYYTYRGKVAGSSITKFDTVDTIRKSKIEKALFADKLLEKLDRIILYSDKDLPCMFYYNIFRGKHIPENDLSRVKELAFNSNNWYSFEYILNNYPDRFRSEIKNYLEDIFLKADFNDENKVMYLEGFVKFLLKTKDENYKRIVIQKLKSDESWINYPNWILDDLKKNNIVL